MKKTKRTPFTNHENLLIKKLVKSLGEDWNAIAKKLPGRTAKQIHDRYVNYLREGLINDPWTSSEDEILINMYNLIGPKWTKMSSKLPGRSGNDIKNRWHKHIAKRGFMSFNLIGNQSSSTKNNFIDDLDLSNSPSLQINCTSINQASSEKINSKELINNSLNELEENIFKKPNPIVEPMINSSCDKLYMMNNKKHDENPLICQNNIFEDKSDININNFKNININEQNIDDKFKKSYKNNDLSSSNNLLCSDSSIFNHELEIQTIFDEIYSQNLDFQWF